MSRAYRRSVEYGSQIVTWVPRSHVRPYSAAWVAARARRAAARAGLPAQTRTDTGFIPELTVAGRVAYRDPGPVDRWLWRSHH